MAKRRALTPKQQHFVEQYAIHQDATRAAKEAGYSPKSAQQLGYQLLQHPSVAEAIETERKARAKRLGITADRVDEEYSHLAYARITDVMSIRHEEGVLRLKIKPSEEWDDRIAAAVQEVSETVSQSGSVTVRVKMHSKSAGLDGLRRRHAPDATQKHEHTHHMSWAELVEEADES